MLQKVICLLIAQVRYRKTDGKAILTLERTT